MTIITQGTIPPGVDILTEIAKQCDADINKKEKERTDKKKKKSTCQKLGQDKHKCCDDKIKDHRNKNPPDGDPKLDGERGYKRPEFDDKTGQPIQPIDTTPLDAPRGDIIKAAAKGAKTKGLSKKAARKAVRKAIGEALAGTVWPDAAIVGPPKRMVDFKFACPESHRSKKKSTKKNYRKPKQSRDQEAAHNALGDAPTITIQIP